MLNGMGLARAQNQVFLFVCFKFYNLFQDFILCHIAKQKDGGKRREEEEEKKR